MSNIKLDRDLTSRPAVALRIKVLRFSKKVLEIMFLNPYILNEFR